MKSAKMITKELNGFFGNLGAIFGSLQKNADPNVGSLANCRTNSNLASDEQLGISDLASSAEIS